MAGRPTLAHRSREWIRAGAVPDQADLARVVGVSQARVTQVMIRGDKPKATMLLERCIATKQVHLIEHAAARAVLGWPK